MLKILTLYEFGAVTIPPIPTMIYAENGWPKGELQSMYSHYSDLDKKLHSLNYENYNSVRDMNKTSDDELNNLDFLTLMNLYLLQENIDFLVECSTYDTFVKTVKSSANLMNSLD